MTNQCAGFSKDWWLCWNCLHVHSLRGFHRAGDQSLRRQLKNGGEGGGGHAGWWRVKACGLRIRQQEARLRQGYRAFRCDDPTDVNPSCSSEPLLRVRIIFSMRWWLTKARLIFITRVLLSLCMVARALTPIAGLPLSKHFEEETENMPLDAQG